MSLVTRQVELTTSAATIYTATNVCQITACDVYNKTATADSVTVYIIKSGGNNASADTCVYVGSVPGNAAGSTLPIPIAQHVLGVGDFIQAKAATGSALNLKLSIAETG